MKVKDFTGIAIILAATFGLSACKKETSIDSKILEELKTPCEGEIISAFQETKEGWQLVVTCASERSTATRAKSIIDSAGGQAPGNGNADKLMRFE